MTAMSEKGGYVLGPQTRAALLRRHDGYAVVLVLDEGPMSHERAQARIRELNSTSEWITKAEAAELLGLTQKGVDFLRGRQRLTWKHENKRVLICAKSVSAELERRNAG